AGAGRAAVPLALSVGAEPIDGVGTEALVRAEGGSPPAGGGQCQSLGDDGVRDDTRPGPAVLRLVLRPEHADRAGLAEHLANGEVPRAFPLLRVWTQAPPHELSDHRPERAVPVREQPRPGRGGEP